jgi:putative MFS transporter
MEGMIMSDIASISNIAARLDRLPISKFHYRMLGLLGVGMFFDGFDIYILAGIIAAQIKTGFATLQMAGYLVSIGFGGLFLGALVSGYLSDRFGRRTMFIWNMLIYSIGSLLCAISVNFDMLLAMRFIAAFGIGGELPIGYALFGEIVPPGTRGRWGAMLALATNISLPIAAFLGMLIIPLSPEAWRWMFVIAGIPAFPAWWIQRSMQESPRWYESVGKHDKAEEAIRAIEDEVERSTGQKLSFVETTKLSTVEAKVSLNMLFGKQLIARTFLASIIFIIVLSILYMFTTWIPSVLVKSGITIAKSMWFTTIMMLGGPVGAIICIVWNDKWSRKWMSVVLSVTGCILAYLYAMATGITEMIILGFVVTTVIYCLIGITFSAYIPELFPTRLRATGNGFGFSLGRLATAFTPPLVIYLMKLFGFSGVMIAVSIMFVSLAIFIAVLGIDTKNKTLEEINEMRILKADPSA